MSHMAGKTITRSVRLDEETNAELEALALAAHMSVSEYIRWALAEVAAKETRLAAHRRSMALFASLPQLGDPDASRREAWGLGTRVPH